MSTCQHVAVGDELGRKAVVGARDDDGDVEGGTKPHDVAQKGPRLDSCGVYVKVQPDPIKMPPALL